MRNKGFSLIEVLVGVAIIVSVTTIVLSMIVSTFRITNKSTTNSTIRQNGNYALSQISRMLQFADSFEGASTSTNVYDETAYDPLCMGTFNHIKYKQDDTDRYFTCSANSMKTGNSTSMNTSIDESLLQIANCTITCEQNSYSEGPVVTISFDLMTKSTESLVEKKASQHFTTTVKMRNP